MNLNKTKQNKPLLIAIFLSLGLCLLGISQWNISEFKADVKESILSYDIGLSDINGPGEFLRKIPGVINYRFSGTLENNTANSAADNAVSGIIEPEFQKLFIDINPEDYRKILEDRDNAIAANVLVNPREVNARIRFDGKWIKGKVRLKGDLPDHWLSQRRFSMRLKMKGNESILGFNEFSLQKPASRQHPYDSVFQSVVKMTGNLSSSHEYVHVFFNGEPWGIMIMEEAMTSEFLEKQKRKESLIIRFSNEDKGVIQEKFNHIESSFYDDYRLSDDILYAKIYESSKALKNPVFRKWYSYILQERLKQRVNGTDLFDIDAYAKTLFVATLWNDGHPLWHANSRHYFNPYTLQLEPITTDAFIPFSIEKVNGFFPRAIFDPVYNNSIYNYVISSDQFAQNFEENYSVAKEAVLTAKARYEIYRMYFPLDDYDNYFINSLAENLVTLDEKGNRQILLQDHPLKIDMEVEPPTPDQASLLTDHVYFRHFENGRIDFYNLLPDEVILENLIVDNLHVMDLDITLPAYKPGIYKPLSIQTELTGLLDDRIGIYSRYRDSVHYTGNTISLHTQGIHNPLSKKMELKKYPFITKEKQQWVIHEGKWNIDEPLVIEGDLKIEKGTQINFSPSAYLIVKGASVFQGTKEEPIELYTSDSSWKGIYILESDQVSQWSHVKIRNYTALSDGLLNLTGGITFYRSDVVMSDVELSQIQGEDALNIVESEYVIDRITIRNAVSDGFDSDFSNGSISDSLFEEINGDAVDFSGSHVEIENIKANTIFDKAVSVGEASNVSVKGGSFSNVGVGIVSKDGSFAYGTDIDITNYSLSGAMSYQKKSFYNEAVLHLEDIKVSGEEPFIRQQGSVFQLDEKLLKEVDVDVDFLYENTVMKK